MGIKQTTLILICGLVCVGVFTMTLPTRGATVAVSSFIADKDATAMEDFPDDNMGTGTLLYVGNNSNYIEETYIGFTFTKPTVAWSNAEIRLTSNSIFGDMTMLVGLVTEPWNETGTQGNLTWNHRPAMGVEITSKSLLKSMPVKTIISIDVTTLMSSLTNTISIRLYVVTLTIDGEAVFYCLDDPTPTNRPMLEFTYTEAPAGISG